MYIAIEVKRLRQVYRFISVLFFILLFVKKVLACIEPNQKRWTMFYEKKREKKTHPQFLTPLVKHGRSFVSILLHHFHVFVHFCSVKASKIKNVDSKYAFGLRMYFSVLLKRAFLLVTFVFQQLWGSSIYDIHKNDQYFKPPFPPPLSTGKNNKSII